MKHPTKKIILEGRKDFFSLTPVLQPLRENAALFSLKYSPIPPIIWYGCIYSALLLKYLQESWLMLTSGMH